MSTLEKKVENTNSKDAGVSPVLFALYIKIGQWTRFDCYANIIRRESDAMESVINKLAEIETAATKIMQAAENQKKLQDEQQEERIAKFDADLEAETAKRIEEITTKLHSTTDADQKKQRDSAAELLSSLDAYYEQNHGTLSTQIYENIIRK